MPLQAKLFDGRTPTDILSEKRTTSEIITEVSNNAHIIWSNYQHKTITEKEMENQMQTNGPEARLLDIYMSIDRMSKLRDAQNTLNKSGKCSEHRY